MYELLKSKFIGKNTNFKKNGPFFRATPSVHRLGCRGCGAAGIPSEDEVEEESSSFVGENAGDCGLWDLGGDGGLYSGGGE